MKKAHEIKEYKILLRDGGFKATPGKIELLSVLSSAEKPLSLQRIGTRLRTRKLDQATLYRALRSLEDAGLVRAVSVGHAHPHYELNTDHHHHLICRSCGAISGISFCFGDKDLKKILKRSKKFATIERHSLEFFGLCKGCARKK